MDSFPGGEGKAGDGVMLRRETAAPMSEPTLPAFRAWCADRILFHCHHHPTISTNMVNVC